MTDSQPIYHNSNYAGQNWTALESRLLLPGGDEFHSAEIYFEFPGWAGIPQWDITITSGVNVAQRYHLGAGYYRLTIALAKDLGETCISTFSEQGFEVPGLGGLKAFRVLGVAVTANPADPDTRQQMEAIGSPPQDPPPGYSWLMEGRVLINQKVEQHIVVKDTSGVPGSKTIYWDRKEVGRTKSLATLKGKFGEDCFIVASGPSITEVDFSLLKDKTLFAVNGAIQLLNDHPIHFPLYMVIAHKFAISKYSLLKQGMSSGAHCFFRDWIIEYIVAKENRLPSSANIYHIGETRLEKAPSQELDYRILMGRNISITGENLENGLFLCNVGTVVFIAVQLCYYLGFRRVFILGMDLGTSGDRARFYDEDIPEAVHHDRRYLTHTEPAFKLLSKLMQDESVDFSVYNLSGHSRLPDSIIPKISLSQALAMTESNTKQNFS